MCQGGATLGCNAIHAEKTAQKRLSFSENRELQPGRNIQNGLSPNLTVIRQGCLEIARDKKKYLFPIAWG